MMNQYWKMFAIAFVTVCILLSCGCIERSKTGNITSDSSQNQSETINKVAVDESVIIQHSDGTVTIPIKSITNKRAIKITDGDTLTNNVEYEVNGIKLGFHNFGYGPYPNCRGFATNTKYMINGTQLNINIGPNMDPHDNVIEGYMFYDFLPNGTVLIYIYVDEDWKNRIKPTTIIWGKMDSWYNHTYTKPFEFNKVADGVYRDIIVDDPNRWLDNYTCFYGGVKVGKEDIYLGL